MRVVLVMSALMAVSALVPSVKLNTAFRFSSGPAEFKMSATSLKMAQRAVIPNPFKSLPWTVKKEKEREARRLKFESASLHRELGITEDATYEEITEVTQKLIAKADAASDIKKKIKVEVAKDRILQIRLNERLAGLKMTNEALAQSRLEEEDEEEEDPDFDDSPKEWRVPKWADGIIKKPDEAWRNRQLKCWGGLSFMCIVLPPMADKALFMNWLLAAGQVGFRGMGENLEAHYNPLQGRRNKPHQRTAVLLALLVWIVLRVWVSNLKNVTSMFGPKYIAVTEVCIMNVFLGIFTAYTQTYKEK